jgi:hypothetical protein
VTDVRPSRKAPDPERPRTALICGTFDVGNFGDLLFPIVAAQRLRSHGWEVLPASPTAGSSAMPDAAPSRDLAEAMTKPRVAAVLIGGGDIVHGWRAGFLGEYQEAGRARWSYPALWFGATVAACVLDVPIAWNAPGAPAPFPERLRRVALEPALAAADYVSVRDEASRAFLAAGDGARVSVVPDTVAGLADVWPAATLDTAIADLRARKGISADEALVAVQARPGGLGQLAPAALAAAIADFAAPRGLTPLLLSIGPSLGDADLLREISGALGVRHVLVDDPRSLRETAAALATSRLYVGNSMHGYVAAACYGVPGVIVARPGFQKFAGFVQHLERPGDVARDWPQAFSRAAARFGEPARLPPSIAQALHRHWETLAAAIGEPEAGRARRVAFLRTMIGHGLGWGWLLEPFVGRSDLAGRPRQPEPAETAAEEAAR